MTVLRRFFSSATTFLGVVGLVLCVACEAPSTSPPPSPPSSPLLGLGVSPLYPVVPVGEVIQFRATGYLEDSSTVNMTDIVDWQSWNTEILDITDALDWEGKALGVAEGSSKVRAVHEGVISNEVLVTVVDAQLEQLTISPSTVALVEGDSLQLVAEAAFTDGSHGEVTGSVQWITEDPMVATVWPDGELVGVQEGVTHVVARWGDSGDPGTEAFVTVQVLEPGQQLSAPDLRVLDVSATAIDGTVYWSVGVENTGEQAASTFWVELWANRSGPPPAPPAVGDSFEVVSVLGAGESRVVTLSLSDLAPGEYQSWILLDSLGVVDESDENNNVSGPTEVTVEEPKKKPKTGGTPDIDLLWLEGFTVTAPEGVFYFVDVQNLGDGPTGPFSLGIYQDVATEPDSSLPPDDLLSVDSIEPGEIRYLSRELPGLISTSVQSWVLADPNNEVDESNETNNSIDVLILPD